MSKEMAKGGGVKQTRPQETDSTYSKAIDKQVAGKPVGWRFTDKLAKKLGKKAGTKPTAQEIEKYKNKGVYFETRKNKSDLNPKAKLDHGGDSSEILSDGSKLDNFTAVGIAEGFVENDNAHDQIKAWAYIQRHGMCRNLQGWFGRTCAAMIDRGIFDREGNIDYEVVDDLMIGGDDYAKGGDTGLYYINLDSYGFDDKRFQNFLKNNNIKARKTSQNDEEQEYKFVGKKSNLENLLKKFYSTNYKYGVGEYFDEEQYDDMVKDIKKYRGKFEEGGDVDYAKGGDTGLYYINLDSYGFDDKRFQNFLKNNNIKARKTSQNDEEQEYKFIAEKSKLENLVKKYYSTNYYSTKSGKDKNSLRLEEYFDEEQYDDMVKDIKKYRGKFEEGGDIEYAKGGQTAPQRESYSKRGDKEVKAKPAGYRFTEKLANRLSKNVYAKPTPEQVSKYSGKGVYFENRKDKSDVKPNEYLAMGGVAQHGLREGDKIISAGGEVALIENGDKTFLVDITNGQRREAKGLNIGKVIKNPKKEDGGDVDYAKGGKIYDSDDFRDWLKENKSIFYKNVEGSFLDEFIEEHYQNMASHNENFKNLMAWTQDESYAKGGQTAAQRESYSKRGDREVKAKPVGYRFTDALAKRLGKSATTKPTAEQIRKYLGKGIYFENRKDKSDIKPNEYLAKGGGIKQTRPQETDSTYSKSIDKQVSGKPVGYRFTDKLAKRLGKNPLTAPKISEIEKYKGKGVYFETRKNKSDINPKGKLAYGGVTDVDIQFARGGGVPRTSNADSKAFTENHLPFVANNLEGKTLENGDYVVLSYGYYPIWFWHKRTNKWYGNKDKFSVTTAKHISQSRPTYEAEMLSRGEMDNLMSKSIEGKDFKEMGGTLDSFVVAQQ
jgi:hypothetical protein